MPIEETKTNQKVITNATNLDVQNWLYELKLRKLLDPFVDKIIVKRGRQGIWEVIEEIMKFMKKYHRAEMQEIVDAVKQDRDQLLNDLGTSKDKTVRRLGSIPERVETLLRRVYLDEWPMPIKDFRREFFKRYPIFRIARKI